MKTKPWVAINAQGVVIGHYFTDTEAYAANMSLLFFEVEYRPSSREVK